MTVCCTFERTSTVGDSPVTVIVSLTEPTSIFALMVATNAALMRTSGRSTLRKPWSSNFTL
jgi:hypothetical protein